MLNSLGFGQRLKEHRIRAGFSQRELADRLELHFTYISKIENGVVPPPSRELMERAADTLGISLPERDELFLLADKMPADLEGWVVDNPDAVTLYRTIKKAPRNVQEQLLRYLIHEAEERTRPDGGLYDETS